MTVTFSIKDGKDGGSLSGTLTQKVKPGETCSTVTATAKEGYSLEWGCTEGRIENVNNGTLTFTVPANTKLESISVWVTFKNKHTHTWSDWKVDESDSTKHGRGQRHAYTHLHGQRLHQPAQDRDGEPYQRQLDGRPQRRHQGAYLLHQMRRGFGKPYCGAYTYAGFRHHDPGHLYFRGCDDIQMYLLRTGDLPHSNSCVGT